MNTLLLWDIDGTLLTTGGVSRAAFAEAFAAVTGCPVSELAETSGRTDPTIFADTLARHDLVDPGAWFAQFADLLGEAYRDRHAQLRRAGRVLPGAAAALADFGRRPGFVQTVLTGNVRSSATAKLEAFALDEHLRLDLGAYGDDHAVRADLVPLALGRARAATGQDHAPVIIGDTVHDVTAGHEHGVPVIAVATGRYTAADLRAAGADAVLPDLTGVAAAIDQVTAPRQSTRQGTTRQNTRQGTTRQNTTHRRAATSPGPTDQRYTRT